WYRRAAGTCCVPRQTASAALSRVGVDVVPPSHGGHRGATHMRLADDAQLLLDRMLTARGGTPAQRISLDRLLRGSVHLSPTWTPTMCPRSASSLPARRPAMR